MKFHLRQLTLSLRRGEVVVPFSEVNYFWGQMGAGKTSIALLIDYCLGGDIELTPALQIEFVAARLDLALERGDLSLERPREADRVIARWALGGEPFQASVPIRSAAGEVIPGTGVEVLSDLIFWLSGVVAPRVRRSKIRQDAELARLSIRDLLWYCYLDQHSIDSSFFHLDEKDANPFKRLKSRDVLRYVVGFHDEKVAELEAQLDQSRGQRNALESALASTLRALASLGVSSQAELDGRVQELRRRAAAAGVEIDDLRDHKDAGTTTHALDDLAREARRLGVELARGDDAIAELRKAIDKDERHLNEVETLSLKFRRSLSARAVLSGVEFQACPRCVQALPARDAGNCRVCGQPDHAVAPDPTEEALIERDAKARGAELREVLGRHADSLARLERERLAILARKGGIEAERNEASLRSDSAFLSAVLARERARAALLQEAESLASLGRLTQLIEEQRESIARIEAQERGLREELKAARAAAEDDATNLERLKGYYLDCLIRAGVPGISGADQVEIPTTNFYPVIRGELGGVEQVTSFATISSGGKKNLLKCCFAVAVHRLAAAERAPLPGFLMIDSAMKNISERENREQFEGFYRMLYELKAGELAATQLILIDKEYKGMASEFGLGIAARHMRPGGPDDGPLIPYYEGK